MRSKVNFRKSKFYRYSRLYRYLAILNMLVLAWLTASSPLAQAENRTALVFGNAKYQKKHLELGNPEHDAEDIASALRQSGFDVMLKINQTKRDMEMAIREFGKRLLSKGGVGLFYYAGHGAQVKGQNYLVPVDARVESEDEAPYESVVAQSVLDKMRTANNNLNIIILDACRDNPYPSVTRSASNTGLARMNAPTGSIMAFSTSPNGVALDGQGRNGLYTQELLRNMLTPGLKIEDLFKRVRRSVRKISEKFYGGDSGRAQIPWENSSIEGDFYFIRGHDDTVPAAVANKEPPQTSGEKTANRNAALFVFNPDQLPSQEKFVPAKQFSLTSIQFKSNHSRIIDEGEINMPLFSSGK